MINIVRPSPTINEVSSVNLHWQILDLMLANEKVIWTFLFLVLPPNDQACHYWVIHCVFYHERNELEAVELCHTRTSEVKTKKVVAHSENELDENKVGTHIPLGVVRCSTLVADNLLHKEEEVSLYIYKCFGFEWGTPFLQVA